MEWLQQHKLYVGLAADVLTFGGGLLLARDAFLHLKEVRDAEVEAAFRRRFPKTAARMKDQAAAKAAGATRLAYRGAVLLGAGFICQILSRFLE